METTKSTGKYWLYFLISLVVMILLMIFVTKFFWLALPFVLTYFAKGLDLL
jgi:uncharacterized membrane protein